MGIGRSRGGHSTLKGLGGVTPPKGLSNIPSVGGEKIINQKGENQLRGEKLKGSAQYALIL